MAGVVFCNIGIFRPPSGLLRFFPFRPRHFGGKEGASGLLPDHFFLVIGISFFEECLLEEVGWPESGELQLVSDRKMVMEGEPREALRDRERRRERKRQRATTRKRMTMRMRKRIAERCVKLRERHKQRKRHRKRRRKMKRDRTKRNGRNIFDVESGAKG